MDTASTGAGRSVFTADHEIFRTQVRRFFEREVVPYHREWERAEIVPREVWRKAGAEGLLCPMLAEEYGGAGADFGYAAVIIEEIARTNASGIGFPLHSDIVVPYIEEFARPEKKREWLPRMAKGEIITAIAMTEPGMGSDLKAVRTTARRDGSDWIINGSKTFISNGQNCGLVIVVCKTDPGAGRKGISLICVEEGTPGFTKGRNLEKIGMHAADTSELFFDDVRVPASQLLGEEGQGFIQIMKLIPQERLSQTIMAQAGAQRAFDEAVNFAAGRSMFGSRLLDMQNTRFTLADHAAHLQVGWAHLDRCINRMANHALTTEEACAAKLWHTEMQWRITDECLQLHGGAGYMNEYTIARLWRDARVQRIYGGTSEVLKEVIGRNLVAGAQ